MSDFEIVTIVLLSLLFGMTLLDLLIGGRR